jgi:MbtH protein
MADPMRVVINHEEQYSIWPADRPLPRGWRDGGRKGTREACLDYIEEVWTDLRALSAGDRTRKLRQMEELIRRDAR